MDCDYFLYAVRLGGKLKSITAKIGLLKITASFDFTHTEVRFLDICTSKNTK
jgi:hypothetical protein